MILPIVLALIMFGMGLNLKPTDFYRIIVQPKASLLGLGLQILFLPAMALIIIALLPLSATAAAGLFLLSLCPGGATSNLFSYLARGDIALSVTLTGCVSLLSPFSLPIAFNLYFQLSDNTSQEFFLPLIPAIKQLTIVTLMPTAMGMMIRHFAPGWSNQVQGSVKIFSAIAMVIVVVMLMISNVNVMLKMFSLNAFAVLFLSTSSLLIAYIIAGKYNLPEPRQRSIAIEVGVQNAGTAMMVALSILHKPELALIPLMYGLLMNLPAFAFIVWLQKKDATTQYLEQNNL